MKLSNKTRDKITIIMFLVVVSIIAYALFCGGSLLFASCRTKYIEHSKCTEIVFADGSKTYIGNSAAFGEKIELSNK